MKLYFLKGACSFASRIIINEIGLKCEFESVDRSKKTASGEDFLAICAKGYTPALKLDDGTILTEGSVILQYLAETSESYNLLPRISNMKRYDVLSWIGYIGTEIHKNCSPIFNPNISEDLKVSIFRPNLVNRLNYIETHLAGKEFLSNDEFTIADAYFYTTLTWSNALKIELLPNIQVYKARISARPSVVKSFEQENS